MKSNLKFFKKLKTLPADEFIGNVLYDSKFGYYNSKLPFGEKGDFITSPKISYLFSEMIAIWLISTWEIFGRPKTFNIIELGPGDCSLKKVQKKNILNKEVRWINNFDKIKKGPVIFFGNEFFDAIPIKQFKNDKGSLFEKNYTINQDYKIKEVFTKASDSNVKIIKSFKTLKNLRFVELPN